jgi:hypothetical protein
VERHVARTIAPTNTPEINPMMGCAANDRTTQIAASGSRLRAVSAIAMRKPA